MEVELLVVPDCPNEAWAHDLAVAALEELDLDIAVTTTVIADVAVARTRGFGGSPTFLIDGRDPFAEPDTSAGLACRLYQTTSGLAGVPTLDQLTSALRMSAVGIVE